MTPFGRYSEIVISGITAFLIVVAILGHVIGVTADLTFVDLAAATALGAVYGKQSASNGYAAQALAAHRRLDAIGAPPANDGAGVPVR